MSSRSIKFRIYDTLRKRWLHDTEHAVSLFGETILLGELLSYGDDKTHVKVDEIQYLVPQEFTDLHDKNGKEIFEGDIIKISTDPESHVVITTAYIDPPGSGHYGSEHLLENNFEGCEIIGNIFDDPELLKM